jgi:hypothetical protein
MKPDPAIDAIREVRHHISASCDHDARKLVDHYRKLQERRPERVLSRAAKELKTTDKSVA